MSSGKTETTAKLFDSYNAGYVQEMYERFVRDPGSVSEEWRTAFINGHAEAAGLLTPEGGEVAGRVLPDSTGTEEAVRRLLPVIARAAQLVQAYREHGHLLARLDPLGSDPPGHPQLDPSFFGVTREELASVPAAVVGIDDADESEESLAGALERLHERYSGHIAYEFEHLEAPDRVEWLWEQVESGSHWEPLDDEAKRELLRRLSRVEGLERFIHRAYLGQKRFSIEGTDMMVPMLDVALEKAAGAGAREVILGMAHRGRLNVLAHIVGVPYEDVLREFEGRRMRSDEAMVPEAGTGDVKYHHGARGEYETSGGTAPSVRLAPNPSHLEFVNPVVEGMTRARQTRELEAVEPDTRAVLPILLHGDAAFAAEGVVAETLNLARLDGYATGGTLHIIVNNQLGFTTTPDEGRSTRYASDLAKGYDIPVIHVNADDPEACLAAVRLALAYRQRFHNDVLIDLVGYRRHGHNEGDEPAYTQPVIYDRIDEHPSVRERWARTLVEDGAVSEDDVEAISDGIADELRAVQDRVEGEAPEEARGDLSPVTAERAELETGVGIDALVRLNEATLTVPDGFEMNPKLARQFDRRKEGFGPDAEVDWAHAETLAFASLLDEGTPVRLSGQDAQRGTFSQRHLVLHDAGTGEIHRLLDGVGGASFEILNSPLSEQGALGYEYGYSTADHRTLVLWEAQFGDFVNAAQVAIDQFIVSGRAKWDQISGLTMLLPHGYEGQGPEHSSARIERFLQLAAEDNVRIAIPTTPAQYFHLLRRQAERAGEESRPLVVFTPKSLLRHPLAVSSVESLSEGTFRPVLDPVLSGGEPEDVDRLVLCAGKVYYDLVTADGWGEEVEGIGIARVEELYPFPRDALAAVVEGFPNLREIVWTQEEPRNMGALTYVGPRLRGLASREVGLRYVARPQRASPAEGRSTDHKEEQARLVRDALRIEGGGG